MDLIGGYESDSDGSISNELSLCMMCGKNPKNYKCPRCSIFTCSLTCCRQHKIDKNCSGQRDRVEYIAAKDFKASNLRSDYHFLEDVLQAKKRVKYLLGPEPKPNKRQRKVKQNNNSTSTLIDHSKSILPSNTQSTKKLLKACQHRNITLITLSDGMTKRKLNTSYFQQKADILYWRLHIILITNNIYQISDLFKVDPLEDKSDHFSKKLNLIEVCQAHVKESTTIDKVLTALFDATAVSYCRTYLLILYAYVRSVLTYNIPYTLHDVMY